MIEESAQHGGKYKWVVRRGKEGTRHWSTEQDRPRVMYCQQYEFPGPCRFGHILQQHVTSYSPQCALKTCTVNISQLPRLHKMSIAEWLLLRKVLLWSTILGEKIVGYLVTTEQRQLLFSVQWYDKVISLAELNMIAKRSVFACSELSSGICQSTE